MSREETLNSLTVKELRERLGELGLTRSGAKSALVERILGAEAALEDAPNESSALESAPDDSAEPPDTTEEETAENGSEWIEIQGSHFEENWAGVLVYVSDGNLVTEAFRDDEGVWMAEGGEPLPWTPTHWSPIEGDYQITAQEFVEELVIPLVAETCSQCGADVDDKKPFNGPRLCENCVRGLFPGKGETALATQPKPVEADAPRAAVNAAHKGTTVLPSVVSQTVAEINRFHEKRYGSRHGGQSIGISQIGLTCDRAIWYGWRWATKRKVDGRFARLLQTGEIEEERIISELRAIGVQVWNTRGDFEGPVAPYKVAGQWVVYNRHGKPLASFEEHEFQQAQEWAVEYGQKQIKMVWLDGHLSGRSDGVGLGFKEAPKTPHKIEIKSAGDKGFRRVTKDAKPLSETEPKHYAQVQMGMGKLGLKRAAYLVVNKNDDEIYMDRIEYDPNYYQLQLDRIERIIRAEEPPPKIKEDPSFWICKFCDHKDVCHYGNRPQITCRSCAHSTPVLDGSGGDANERGKWVCEAYGDGKQFQIPIDVQENGCNYHLFLPGIVGGLEYRRADQNNKPPEWVEYVDEWGEPIANVISTELDGPAKVRAEIGTIGFRSHEFPNVIIGKEDYAALREHIDDCPF